MTEKEPDSGIRSGADLTPAGATLPAEPGLQTAVVETARSIDATVQTANLPVYRASTVLFDSLDQARERGKQVGSGMLHQSTYSTVGTPTTFALMDALAEIEGRGADCRAALMPSGLAAITTALLAFLKPGDQLLMSDSVYGPARAFAQDMLADLGIQTIFYDPLASPEDVAELITPATRVLYLESPGSYTFELQDMPALCAMARSRGLISMVDNAWASPIFARPFDWGVDLSIVPLTKYWSGHSDVLMGAIVVREEHWQTVFRAVRQLGLCVGGDDAFLILRGLRTANVRMQQHQSSALAVARWLQTLPEVASVLHPALPEHPRHEWFMRDFTGSSGLFSFELSPSVGEAGVKALVEKRKHFGIGYSWGGFESLVMPASLGAIRTVSPWRGGQLIRLHIGLEDPNELIADLSDGFELMQQV